MSNKFFSCLAVAALLFVGCSKNDDNTIKGGSDENYDIYLKFDLGAATRADTTAVGQGTVTQFSQGAVFFTDVNGAILRMAIIDDSPAGAVTSAQIQAGYLFTDIEDEAVKVYVVGNHDFGTDTYVNISNVQAVTKGILTQTDDNFGVNNATLYGTGDIIPAVSTEATSVGADREAIFTISPIIARLEIDKITGSGDITKFNLAGIYINNFYVEMSVVGTTLPADLKHFGTNVNQFSRYLQTSPVQTNGAYLAAWSEYLFDDGGLTSDVFTGVSMSGGPGHTPAKETWAYNVFANGSAVPHIILHFTDVEINGTPRTNTALDALPGNNPGDNDGVAYLTITGYNNRSTGADQPILGGNVYKLDNVQFDHTDLDEYPYENDDKSSVFVKVTVKPWNVIPVDWK